MFISSKEYNGQSFSKYRWYEWCFEQALALIGSVPNFTIFQGRFQATFFDKLMQHAVHLIAVCYFGDS